MAPFWVPHLVGLYYLLYFTGSHLVTHFYGLTSGGLMFSFSANSLSQFVHCPISTPFFYIRLTASRSWSCSHAISPPHLLFIDLPN